MFERAPQQNGRVLDLRCVGMRFVVQIVLIMLVAGTVRASGADLTAPHRLQSLCESSNLIVVGTFRRSGDYKVAVRFDEVGAQKILKDRD